MRLCVYALLMFSFVYGKVRGKESLDSITIQLFDIAKEQVKSGQYQDANRTFLEILSPKKLMPNDLTFYFGKSLYHTGGYKQQCMDFLNKYLYLKGDTGQFYDETVVILKSLGQEFEDHIDTTDQRTTVEKQLDVCENESDFVVCPICNGSNVLTSGAAFGNAFRECNYSDERGLMPCKNYLKYINDGVLLEYKKEE